MRLHEIYLVEADIKTFKKLDIRNITKEWNQWFPQNRSNFDASKFDEFWTQAGYAKSADDILGYYQTQNKIGPWPPAAPAATASNTATLSNTPADWFAIPQNFKEFVTAVVDSAETKNRTLFQDRVDRFMNSRSWWELTGLSREDIARIRGGGNLTRKTSSSSSLPPGTVALIAKIKSRNGRKLKLSGGEPALLDLLIKKYTDELAQVANLSGVREQEVESALKAIQTKVNSNNAIDLKSDDQYGIIPALAKKL